MVRRNYYSSRRYHHPENHEHDDPTDPTDATTSNNDTNNVGGDTYRGNDQDDDEDNYGIVPKTNNIPYATPRLCLLGVMIVATLITVATSFFFNNNSNPMNTTFGSLFLEGNNNHHYTTILSSLRKQQQQRNDNDVNLLTTDETNIVIVLMSDREKGLIVTIGSVLQHSTVPVDVVLIGKSRINNERIHRHFGNRIQTFVSYTIEEAEQDLQIHAGIVNPIWNWKKEWHSSINNPNNYTNVNTIHPGSWDHLMTHAHELNHLRFYLPYLSVFRKKRSFYFLDDDIVVRRNLAGIHQEAVTNLNTKYSMIAPCNSWVWNKQCLRFDFQSQKETILQTTAVYGNKKVCNSPDDIECVPPNYWDFVNSVLPSNDEGMNQKAWNFGFTLYVVDHWKKNQITQRYEHVMQEQYKKHIYPETSLAFGLGVAYIAMAGTVACWDETTQIAVRDGFSFIEFNNYERTFGEDFLNKIDVVHYTGSAKPWVDNAPIQVPNIEVWLDRMRYENMTLPLQLPTEPTANIFLVIGTARSGLNYIMSTLDHHPAVCASGESNRGSLGYPTEVMQPYAQLDWFPECSNRRACSLSFVKRSIDELIENLSDGQTIPERCMNITEEKYITDKLGYHLKRICKFVSDLNGNYNVDEITKKWVEAFVNEDQTLLGCHCDRGVQARGVKVMAEWLPYKNYPKQWKGPADINLNATLFDHTVKVIRVKRSNIWERYMSLQIAKYTGMFHVSNTIQKRNQLQLITSGTSTGNSMTETTTTTTNSSSASSSFLTIDVKELEWFIKSSNNIEQGTDEWITDHAVSVLEVDYNDCIRDPKGCFTSIYNYLGVPSGPEILEASDRYHSSYYDEFHASSRNGAALLQYITNQNAVLDLLSKYNITVLS